jgi:hypothetical protein
LGANRATNTGKFLPLLLISLFYFISGQELLSGNKISFNGSMAEVEVSVEFGELSGSLSLESDKGKIFLKDVSDSEGVSFLKVLSGKEKSVSGQIYYSSVNRGERKIFLEVGNLKNNIIKLAILIINPKMDDIRIQINAAGEDSGAVKIDFKNQLVEIE